MVYTDRNPEIFRDLAPDGTPWRFEFFHMDTVVGPAAPKSSFLAVFFPVQDDDAEIAHRLKNIFPGTELIGYEASPNGSSGTLTKRDDGMLVVHLPMTFPLAEHLLESLAVIRASEQELFVMRNRSTELQEFSDAFINMVESSWNASDRKLGMCLLINKIAAYLRAEESVVYLFNEEGTSLHRAYSTGNIRDLDLFDYHANSAIIEKVLSTGVPYINNNYSFELKVPFGQDSVFIRSILCYPLERRGEKIGIFEVINKKNGAFTEEDQNLVQTLINPLTVAVRTVSMFESSERLTITDDLTKLYNYRYLMQFLDTEVRRCLRYKKKVSLLFIDIDGFKQINDTFGHLVGSQALSELGQVFRRILRETDMVARYGGDEFVIVLPETPLGGAMVIAERIRKKVEDYEFIAHNLSIRLTVSLGVASCPKHALTAVGLIKKADAAMYRAKELSKNSIKVAV